MWQPIRRALSYGLVSAHKILLEGNNSKLIERELFFVLCKV